MWRAAWIPALLLTSSIEAAAASQPNGAPTLRVGMLGAEIHLDGVLNEPAWATAPAIDNLTMSEPTPGAAPSARTIVRVLADARTIVIGIQCDDPDPAHIVSYTKQ